MTDPMGTLPLFEAPQPEPLQPAILPRQSTAVPSWRNYNGKRIPCDECIVYLHEHGGSGPHPRSAQRVRTAGKQQWRLCRAHAEPREAADKRAAELAAARDGRGVA